MNDDASLLRDYVDEKSEPAFTALVRRHLGLVYSVALRRVGGDAHLAEDVAQKVFADLARKAPSLSGHATLSGWLYVSALHASATLVRGEQRRKSRETAAHLMEATITPDSPDEAAAVLRPVVDDAIVELNDDDRTAILLRFFEKRSFPEVAAALRLSDDAARKRVDRALDKLRAVLTRRGITSTGAALGLALAAVGPITAPAELGARVASQALASSGASAGTTLAGFLLSAALPVAVVMVIGGGLVVGERSQNESLRAQKLQLAAQVATGSALRAENIRLAASVAEVAELRRLAANLPELRHALATTAPSKPAKAALIVTPQGTISWGGEPVKLFDFIARTRALSGESAESHVVIQAVGAEFPAFAYVIDEVRKAGIQHVIVESDATPDPKYGWSWF